MAITISGSGITSANIADGTIVNADINSSAAIAASKLTGISAADNTPSFSVYKNAVQSVADSTWTKLELTTEYWDTDSAFDSTTNYRFTVPSGEAGKYHLTAGNGWSRFDNATAGRSDEFRFYKNGSFFRGGIRHYYTLDSASGQYADHEYVMSIDINLAVGDYVELYVWHNEGHNVNTSAAQTFFTGFKLAGV